MFCFLDKKMLKVAISRGYVYCLILAFITLAMHLFDLWIIWSLSKTIKTKTQHEVLKYSW
jgi:hypothetical protein